MNTNLKIIVLNHLNSSQKATIKLSNLTQTKVDIKLPFVPSGKYLLLLKTNDNIYKKSLPNLSAFTYTLPKNIDLDKKIAVLIVNQTEFEQTPVFWGGTNCVNSTQCQNEIDFFNQQNKVENNFNSLETNNDNLKNSVAVSSNFELKSNNNLTNNVEPEINNTLQNSNQPASTLSHNIQFKPVLQNNNQLQTNSDLSNNVGFSRQMAKLREESEELSKNLQAENIHNELTSNNQENNAENKLISNNQESNAENKLICNNQENMSGSKLQLFGNDIQNNQYGAKQLYSETSTNFKQHKTPNEDKPSFNVIKGGKASINPALFDYDEAEIEQEIDKYFANEFDKSCGTCRYKQDFYQQDNYEQARKAVETVAQLEEETINSKPKYYSLIESQYDEMFERYPLYNELSNIIPNSKWLKVNMDNDYYVLGLIYEKGVVKYMCYGVPQCSKQTPPPELAEISQWLPLEVENPYGAGLWIMYQSAETGETLNIDIV